MIELEQQIRERAYSLWESEGEPTERATEFWVRAERELTAFGEDILAARRTKTPAKVAKEKAAKTSDAAKPAGRAKRRKAA